MLLEPKRVCDILPYIVLHNIAITGTMPLSVMMFMMHLTQLPRTHICDCHGEHSREEQGQADEDVNSNNSL